jgi:hypothetical protein
MNYLSKSVAEYVLNNLIISEERKFVYIKIGKVASSTLHHYRIEKDVPDLISKRNDEDRFYQWLKEYDRLQYFVFTFIRNPWDRIVSVWNYHYEHVPEFKKFIRSDFSSYSKQSVFSHTRQQINSFFIEPDFIGRYENLAEDWKQIAVRFGLTRELPHMNKGKEKLHYSKYYDRDDIEIVRNLYWADIERFGYEFERK